MRIPKTRGQWSGDPGNSEFFPDDNSVFYIGHGKRITGKELKDQYGFDSIKYCHYEPDFIPFANDSIGIMQLSIRPKDRDTSYSAAESLCVQKGLFSDASAVKRFMSQNNLVWHECGDGVTMIAIPMAINQAFVHTGGIGINNGLNKIAGPFSKMKKYTLSRKSLRGTWYRYRKSL